MNLEKDLPCQSPESSFNRALKDVTEMLPADRCYDFVISHVRGRRGRLHLSWGVS